MSTLLGATFEEHCQLLNIEVHEFDSPILRGPCIKCGLTSGLHRASPPPPPAEAAPAQQQQEEEVDVPARHGDTPVFKIVVHKGGNEFMSSSWSDQDQARSTYTMMQGNTSLDLKVVMKIGVTEVDILEMADYFRTKTHE